MNGGATCGQNPTVRLSTFSSRFFQVSYPPVVHVVKSAKNVCFQILSDLTHRTVGPPTTPTVNISININKLNTEAPLKHSGAKRRIA